MHSSVQASAVIVLILAIRLLVRRKLRPGQLYCLWMLLLARMVMPWAPESCLSLFNWVPVSQERVAIPHDRPVISFEAAATVAAGVVVIN